MKLRSFLPLLGLALVHLPTAAQACSVCMGADDSKVGEAINGAIFLLLGCIGGVLSLLVAFGIYLMRRANATIPPDVQLQQS